MTNPHSKFLKTMIRNANQIHVAIYKMSKGRIANEIAHLPILLISTCGRKSGKLHSNPVVYIRDGQDYLVAASTGGMDWNPGWYFNLMKQPEARIQVGDKVLDVAAVITNGDERTRLYDQFKAASPNFVKYEKNTSREIPVIRLIPQGRNG